MLLLTLAACVSNDRSGSKQVGNITAAPSNSIGSKTSDVKANKLFAAKSKPSRQSPAAIGSYAKGCLAGGEALPESGPTWQAMRLSRNRNWGHPETIQFIKDLSDKAAQELGWAGLYIGDISQPRGGPMLSGHQSHQMGLDVDIWLYRPARLNLTSGEREKLSSTNVRAKSQLVVNHNWSQQHANILKSAAQDLRVDRIFITPPAKLWLCENTVGNRIWLQKIRPFYGHNTHFHVRLKCPKDLKGCVTQKPTVAEISNGGDGCDKTLQWWFTDYLNPPKATPTTKPKRKKKRGARQYTMSDLPKQCQIVFASD